ncbi:hypothetical protein O181_092005 [Austropuccinia psidii MF-1]|uniref:DUF4939 domain-containing protein n=1 Tax=Austropuccinia psidii MF-1 TaxID=1389203 RepID=A0A9Q3P8N7_9BASI|nr:hypothetical protein [Austropuccinia psidii MF-1]
MPFQHSPPAKNTKSQRHQALLTPTERAPIDCTPSVHQLSENLDRGPPIEGEAPSKNQDHSLACWVAIQEFLKGLEADQPHSNQPLVSQGETKFLEMMEQVTQFMGQITQAVAPRDTSKFPAFKMPSMKAPYSFDFTKAYKLRGLIKHCESIFYNDSANFFSDRKKFLYSISFLTGRARKWIEPYLSNISNEDPFYFLNN